MRIQILAPTLTPYRIFFYDLFEHDLKCKGGALEVLQMRPRNYGIYWKYDDNKRNYTKLLPSKQLGISSKICINFKLKEAINRFSPDIIIACGSYWSPTILQAIRICKRKKIQLLFWSESNKIKFEDMHGVKRVFRECLRKYAYKRMDGFLYPGENALALINDYNKKPGFLFRLPNLIDNKKYYECNISKKGLKKQLNIPKDKIAIFCPARLTRVKGLLPFLELYKHTELKNSAVIYIAGKGEDEQKLRNIISINNLNVVLLGHLNYDNMILYYHACDFFLLPSVSDPSPLSCIEALWSQLPIIISASVGNAPEVLVDGKNGFMFDYTKKIEAIKILDKIKRKISDNEWYLSACKTCLEMARCGFEPHQIVKNLIDALEQSIK